MALRTDSFDLGALRLGAGEGRSLDLFAACDPLDLGGESYRVSPELVPVRLDFSRMTGDGYAMRLRLQATIEGPCMRCLEPAAPVFKIDTREVSQPGGSEDLASPYVADAGLDLRGWVRDALALAVPTTILCRQDCAGLCPICGADLNRAAPGHGHRRAPDPRWSKLSEIRFD
ncbi:MAG: YceD family protein [Solirubrobacteraceae bacterium]